MSNSSVQLITQGLSATSVQDEGVSFKGKSLVLNTEKDCDEVVEAIKSCKNLHYLNLEGNTLGVDACKAISKALETKKELKRAIWLDMFTGRMKEEIPKALEHLGNGLTVANAQLVELDLSDNAFGPIGVKGLAGLLSSKACYQLQILKLNNNGLGISGGKMLANALLQCYNNSKNDGKVLALRVFIAGRNRLENEGTAELAKVFHTLGTLEEIVMPQNGICHPGIKALSESLMNNHNLKVLDLNDNIFTIKGARHFAKALPYLQQLRILNLGDCLLKTNGATLLANTLAEKHEQLEELHFSCNEIKSDGGMAIVKAMANKTKLKRLNLNDNMFGSEGRKQLKEGLERINKIGALESLCDESDEGSDDGDSSHGDDEDEDDDEEDDEEDDDHEEEEEEEEKTNGFTPHKENTPGKFVFQENSFQPKKDTTDILSQVLDGLSIKAKPVGPLKTFLENPTPENFLPVTEDKVSEFIKNNQDSSVDFYVDTFVPLLVKISSVSCCSNLEVMKLSSKVSANLYKDLFKWTSDKNHLAIINNALFVHLGLIKSEDKSFKINWDVKGSLSALKTASSQGSVPETTKNVLECLLAKEAEKKCPDEIRID